MNAELLHRTELRAADRQEMFDLLAAHFSGVCASQFEHDLLHKDWVIRVKDDDDVLTGFTTFAMYRTQIRDDCGDSRTVTVVCSGDTIIDRSKPPCSALLRTWLQSVLRLHAPNRPEPLYWLLIVSGFRTYRFLPVFWKMFYPCYEHPTPTGVQQMMRALASERFGERYDPISGIVRFKKPQVLRDDLNGIPSARLDDPHVEFFTRMNPRHERGDELVCLTELHEHNLTVAGRRMADARRSRALSTVGAH